MQHFIQLKREIRADELLFACTAIAIQFSKRINFEIDKFISQIFRILKNKCSQHVSIKNGKRLVMNINNLAA